MSFLNSVSITIEISVDLHCIDMKAKITETDISKPGQINQNYLQGEIPLEVREKIL